MLTQVLALLIEVKKKGFREHINSILPVTRHIFRSAIDAVTNWQEGFSTESVIPLWNEAYYSLVMFEKMINQFGDLCFAEYLEVNLCLLDIDVYKCAAYDMLVY